MSAAATTIVLTTASHSALRSMVDTKLNDVARHLAADEYARRIRITRRTGTARCFVQGRDLARFRELPPAMDAEDLTACSEFLTDWLRALRGGSADCQ
jgi:hypothetical protein